MQNQLETEEWWAAQDADEEWIQEQLDDTQKYLDEQWRLFYNAMSAITERKD